jgi:glycosyltransferase involved in cell wall biosynthesis
MIHRILHTEWSSGWGGQEQRIVLECRKMMELGHSVLLVCQPGSGIRSRACEQGIPVEEVPIRGGWDLRAILHICRLIRKHRVDIVNTHSGKDTWVGGLAAKLSGATFIRTRHLSIPLSNSPFNFIHRLADGTITTGEAIRTTLITVNRLPADRVISIATGVNTTRFNPETVQRSETLARELGIDASRPVVTMVAVLRSMKRHDIFLRAAQQVLRHEPAVQFLAVGDGPGRETCRAVARELGVERNVIFTGYRPDIPEILKISDIAVLTSDRFEGVPQSLSQAMAMGVPVIAAPVGSIPELISDGSTGLLADVGNADSFACKIMTLLNDPSLRARLGVAGRRHILARYTDDLMARHTVEFYEAVRRRRAPAS